MRRDLQEGKKPSVHVSCLDLLPNLPRTEGVAGSSRRERESRWKPGAGRAERCPRGLRACGEGRVPAFATSMSVSNGPRCGYLAAV